MKGGGEKATPASIEKVKVACMSSLIEGEEESVRAAAASCASALTIFMDSIAIRYPGNLLSLLPLSGRFEMSHLSNLKLWMQQRHAD